MLRQITPFIQTPVNIMHLRDPADTEDDWTEDDELRAREVQKHADRFLRAFGDFPRKAPMLFLEVMEVYSQRMVEEWTEFLTETEEDGAEDF